MEEYVSISKLQDARNLLMECLDFLSLIPNKSVTIDGDLIQDNCSTDFNIEDAIDHYKLCEKVQDFLTKTE